MIIKKITLMLFIILIFSSLIQADTSDYCADEWPDDYRMREYCQNEQRKAQVELFKIAESEGLIKGGSLTASASGSDKEKIIFRCMDEWELPQFDTYDFKMVVYCIKQQFEAYEKTAPTGGSGDGIEGYCANQWPDDYKMRDYCQNQQMEAKVELFDIAESEGLVQNGKLFASATGGDRERIICKCMNEWKLPQFNIYDYKIVVYCIKQQFEAYDRIK